MIRTSRSLAFAIAILVSACGEDDEEKVACNVEAQTGCKHKQVCELVEGGKTGCFAPVTVEGRVVKAADGTTGIAGARVVARDVNGAMASRSVALSTPDGSYKLAFPAQRKSDGTPMVGKFTLRADAAGYATFPSGLRIALQVDVGNITKQSDGSYAVKNPSTDIGLDALENAVGLGTVSGVVKATLPGGTLVVAGGASGIADRDGTFALFNVPAGDQEVRGYLQGIQLKPVTAKVTGGAETKGVELVVDPGALATVTGDVSFVNAGSSQTSVVLVVESTFNTTLLRGEVPMGLRVDTAAGKYTFERVPAGRYVVLAAFENDDLVRDPDTTIGGTALQTITVANAPLTVTGFKITGALSVTSPGATGPEVVSGTPTFVFEDDSSEDGYEVVVYDTFGKEIWRKADVASVSGGSTVSVPYAGPALTPGRYYQFRALSWRDKNKAGGMGRTYISSTEDLKGVFIAK